MPYSHVTRTAYGADAIAYARGNGTGHNGAEARNQYVGAVNMLPDEIVSFECQMQPFWNKADPRHTTQIDRFIVSFSPDELNPDNPEDLATARDIGCEIAKENAPDNQSAVFVQTDGTGHKVHIHILTNDVTIMDHKGVDSRAYAHWHFRPLVDKVCSRYFTLAQPELAAEKITPAVRGARIHNEQIKAENRQELNCAKAENRPVDRSKMKPEKYIWQDDLRERIKTAAAGTWDEDSFARRLRMDGVELVPHKAKDGTMSYIHPATRTQPAHYMYELVDVSRFDGKLPLTLKSKSFKMGANYQPDGIAKLFVERSRVQQDREPTLLPPVKHQKKPEPKEAVRTEPDAEAERRRIAAQRAALMAELQRNAEYITAMERRRREEDREYDDD